MGAYVGVDLAIDGVNTARGWKISQTSNSQGYNASNTQQGTGRACGNVDWIGQYWCYGHTPAYFPGDTFTFQAVTDQGAGLQGAAIIERVRIFWNIAKGDYIAHVVDFARNGALTFTATATDVTQPGGYVKCSEGTKFTYGGTELQEIEEMMLDIRCANRPRVTSSTSGGALRARGNLDAAWSVKSIEHDPSAYPVINALWDLKFYVDATTYWTVNWGKVTASPNDYGGNHETLEYIGGTVEGKFSGHSATSTGAIITPAGTTKWPYP